MEAGADNQPKNKRSPAEPLVPYQWKPGQSGNPKGRPKKRTLTELCREILERDGVTLDGRKMCVDEALAETILTMALRGNNDIIKELWARLEGKPKETLEIQGELRVISVDADAAKGV